MNAKTSLLTALRSYHPRENHDPLENFITEAFAWLLVNNPGFGRFYLGKILERLRLPELPAGAPIEWRTQVNLRGVFPDLVGAIGGETFLFEHKAWSHLHGNQLANYRNAAAAEYPETIHRLILVVGGRHLIDQNPDLGLCWHEVHAWIGEWRSHKEYEAEHLFADFQHLLENEGMGPPAPVSHESILAFRFTRTFEASLCDLARRAFHHPWSMELNGLSVEPRMPSHRGWTDGQDPWGRVGINLLGDLPDWSPGLFVGFLINPTNHRVKWASPDCPDFGAILDVNIELDPTYDKTEAFARLRDALPKQIAQTCPDYCLLDHLAQSGEPNRWHPFHVRRPMVELLRGTQTADEQYARFVFEASRLARAILGCTEFRNFHDALIKGRPSPSPAQST